MNNAMCHYMIDVETLGVKRDAAILSIGIAQFDLIEVVKRVFYKEIDLDSSIKAGFIIDKDTLLWWLEKDKELLHNTLLSKECMNIIDVLKELQKLFTLIDMEKMYVWSHGSIFDVSILEHAYKSYSMEVPWKYRNVRDTRTLFDLAEYDYKPKGGHNALEDAVSQAEGVIQAYKKLTQLKGM